MMLRCDPCGLCCLLITYVALLYADFAIVCRILRPDIPEPSLNVEPWSFFNTVGYNLVVLMLIVAHGKAVFSDPGVVDHSSIAGHEMSQQDDDGDHQKKESQGWSLCSRCALWRPPRAHHCRICRKCIRRMDHHCPWINNCVGEWNQKYFLQFLFYVGVLCVYTLILVAASWYNSNDNVESVSKSNEHVVLPQGVHGRHYGHGVGREALMAKQTRILHSVLLVMESVLFFLFVVAIGCDQCDAIFSDQTLVEQVKSRRGLSNHVARVNETTRRALMAEVCGQSHPALWLWPCSEGVGAKRRRVIKSVEQYQV